MTTCYMVCGADRVGKSTLINRTLKSFPEWVYGKSWHFSAPKVKTNPFQQYENFLKLPFENYGIDYVFMDRGFIETVFYEDYRCGNIITISKMLHINAMFKSRFIEFNPVIIYRRWEDIEALHLEEIKNGINHDKSNEFPELEDRKKEYEAYYRFMDQVSNLLPMSVNWVYNPNLEYLLIPRTEHI